MHGKQLKTEGTGTIPQAQREVGIRRRPHPPNRQQQLFPTGLIGLDRSIRKLIVA